MSEFEIVLARRVVPQPASFIVAGGDCGACVLAGLLGISVERVYDELREKRESIHFSEMARILRCAEFRGLAEAYIDEPAFWMPFGGGAGMCPFGNTAKWSARAWFNYVRMAMIAGYHAIAHVDHERKGDAGLGPNHWVALVGIRSRKVPGKVEGSYSFEEEVLVSCSARSTPAEEWVDAHQFLRERGGFDLLFVKPAEVIP